MHLIKGLRVLESPDGLALGRIRIGHSHSAPGQGSKPFGISRGPVR